MNYYIKYLKYKKKYLFLKGGSIDIYKHPKKSFMSNNISKIKFGNKHIYAILLPHAGHTFIKNIIYLSLYNIQPIYDYIVLLTTNHIDHNNYQPESSFDDLKILNLDNIEKNDEHFMNEHSYLSILSYIKQFNIPVYIISVGNSNEILINSLKKIIKKNILLIGNTDLLHCRINFNVKCPEILPPCPENIEKYNIETIHSILSKKILTENEACGKEIIKTFYSFVDEYESYLYLSSDKITNDDVSVGYVGIVYTKDIDLENFSYLFSLPKKTLELGTNLSIDEIRKKLNLFEKLFIKNISGIFVTIYKNKELRGCIGTFELLGDVIDTIINRTIETATNDTRFEPIQQNESEFLSYKINFLNVPFSIGNNVDILINKLEIGKHGITIKFTDGRQATYLASVLYESFNMTNENKKDKIYEVIESLKNKSNSIGSIEDIELYECYEYSYN